MGESTLDCVDEMHFALARNPYFIPWLVVRLAVLVVVHAEKALHIPSFVRELREYWGVLPLVQVTTEAVPVTVLLAKEVVTIGALGASGVGSAGAGGAGGVEGVGVTMAVLSL